MDWVTIARAVHVIAIVHWIGGVAMVTMVVLPALARMAEPARRLEIFEAIEGRFASQARISVVAAGLSGLYMTWELAAWDRFLEPSFWWMHAMVLIWMLFAIILFIAEPLVLHAWFRRRARSDPSGTFSLVQRAHWVLLALSALTVGAAVLGANGMLQ